MLIEPLSRNQNHLPQSDAELEGGSLSMNGPATFRQIEEFLGLREIGSAGNSSLEVWYEHVRDKPVTEFSDGDIARSCRQKLYMDFVLPIAIERVETNPLAGDLYDGELLVALAGMPREFWSMNRPLSQRLLRVAERQIATTFEDVAEAIHTLSKSLAEDVD